jgi:uncharacterized protein YcbX
MMQENSLTGSLAQILVYPIKALEAAPMSEAQLLPSGALEHDRRFALVDRGGEFIHAKRTASIHRIRATFDLAAWTVCLATDGEVQRFHLIDDRRDLEDWLSTILSLQVRLIENADGGFPDDTQSPGPTVLSTATLQTVAKWFGLSADDVRRRFRANLEIGGVEAFWEDRLYGDPGRDVRFQVGQAVLMGTNPCQRCVVPSRDWRTGEAMPGFARSFAEHRARSLPPWANTTRFDHYYRLATNTRLQAGGTLRIGDEARILTTA